MAYYLDFVGLNTFIYEPVGYESGSILEKLTGGSVTYAVDSNVFGEISNPAAVNPTKIRRIDLLKNFRFSHHLPHTASFFPALMLKRNGPYGFPTWKQIRVGNNPLSRKQWQNNYYSIIDHAATRVELEPRFGTFQRVLYQDKYGLLKTFNEPSVVSKYSPFNLKFKLVDDENASPYEAIPTIGVDITLASLLTY